MPWLDGDVNNALSELVRINGVKFANRNAVALMVRGFCSSGVPGNGIVGCYRKHAKVGAGPIFAEGVAVNVKAAHRGLSRFLFSKKQLRRAQRSPRPFMQLAPGLSRSSGARACRTLQPGFALPQYSGDRLRVGPPPHSGGGDIAAMRAIMPKLDWSRIA